LRRWPREFGISRKTAYKIIDRHEDTRLPTDGSRGPYRHANKPAFQIEVLIARLPISAQP
jgi:putative transposase